MSLLLDALKKSSESDSKPNRLDELQLEEVHHSPALQTAVRPDVAYNAPPPTQASTGTRTGSYAPISNPNASTRAAGENLFAAKKPVPKKKRKPLGIVPIALILGSITATAGGIYVYLEITPPNQRPFYTPPEPVVAVAPAPIPQPAPVTPAVTVAPALVPIEPPTTIATPAVVPPTEKSEVIEKPIEIAQPVTKSKRARKAPRAAVAQGPASKSPLAIERKQEANSTDQLLTSAYQSYQSGDYANAWQRYREALTKEPKNRDALLGLAAISQQQGQDDSALHYYRQVLALDPRDPVALAGISSFGAGDKANKESRLKQLISQQPDSAALHFALGNQYVEQSRWSDAQQAFFNALAIEPSNALFAFNLAVSLDHLGQRKIAARYYQQALQFDASNTAGFNHDQTQQRLNTLNAAK